MGVHDATYHLPKMWKCKRCKKPVYFAERRQSMGFDWHRECLKCEECNKVLNPGQHAEHKEIPYCHIPCYSALFGPRLFGHGSTVESHQSFGKRAGKVMLQQTELFKKVKEYNDHMENNGLSRLALTSREVNGRLVFEGVLRVYWGIQHSIRVKEEQDFRPIMRRKSPKSAIERKESTNEKKDDTNYNRHSVHHFNLIGQSKEFTESLDTKKAEEVLEKGMLTRTLSDTKIDAFSKLDLNSDDKDLKMSHDNKTLPTNINRRNPSFLQFKLDRFETSLDLPAEMEHLKIKSDPKSDITPDSTLTNGLGTECQDGIQETECHVKLNDTKSERGQQIMENSKLQNGIDHEKVQSEIDPEKTLKSKKSTGPRALRRRHGVNGKKYEKSTLQRRKSFNGHWYNRDTSVFTPSKNSVMSIWVTSLLSMAEVLKMVLEKYQVESDHDNYGLFLVKDSGERRQITPNEFPLLLRVNSGPHEDVAKFQLMELKYTSDIKPEVAQFLKFTYTECRAIVDMFYEEEEREVEQIKRKYRLKRRCLHNMINRAKTKMALENEASGEIQNSN